MAQTKRKRRSKHRGTAAGTIETRGRTGRPPTGEEKKKDNRVEARERRMYTPPTWKAAAKRAGLAAMLMFAFLLLVGGKNTSLASRLPAAVLFAIAAFGLYVGLGFYMDQFLYRRRIRKRDEGR
ncbi:MAG: hypothetical protein M3065_13290 [Actinomycetota bacterium]|nr:hypothetical protein [Actinomycetota bacterium]